MPINVELPHIIQEQIRDHVITVDPAKSSVRGVKANNELASRMANLESKVNALSQQCNAFFQEQEKLARAKGNQVDYGLKVLALHDMRLIVEAGQAAFLGKKAPVKIDYTFLELVAAASMRQMRYIYLSREGIVSESTTDPASIGKDYLPLAIVDVWPNTTQITQQRIRDIRPGQVFEVPALHTAQGQLQGDASIKMDTGSDSFVISANVPPDKTVHVSAGQALIDGVSVEAAAEALKFEHVNQVTREFISFFTGTHNVFDLYHRNVSNETVYINDMVKTKDIDYTIDYTEGRLILICPLTVGDLIEISYTFIGSFAAVVLVKKVLTEDGYPYGIIGFQIGSNRPDGEGQYQPQLSSNQHVIGKIEMSTETSAITDSMIDNAYEVVNLDQATLQTGGKLTGTAISPSSITTQHISAEGIDAGVITSGVLDASLITIESSGETGVRIDYSGIHVKNGEIEIQSADGRTVITAEGLTNDALHPNMLFNSSFAILKK